MEFFRSSTKQKYANASRIQFLPFLMILDLSQNHLVDSLKRDKGAFEAIVSKEIKLNKRSDVISYKLLLLSMLLKSQMIFEATTSEWGKEKKNLFNLKFMEQARKAAIFLTVNDFIYPFGRMTTFLSRQWLSRKESWEEWGRHGEMGKLWYRFQRLI